jgi:hypothetical protein
VQWCFLRTGIVLGISGNQCLKRHIIILWAVPKTSVSVLEMSQNLERSTQGNHAPKKPNSRKHT